MMRVYANVFDIEEYSSDMTILHCIPMQIAANVITHKYTHKKIPFPTSSFNNPQFAFVDYFHLKNLFITII